MKEDIHMIISIAAEEAFGKIQHHFLMKTPNKPGREGNFFTMIKSNNAIPNIPGINAIQISKLKRKK